LTTKQQNPGILYAAISRAKTMGYMTPNNPHPKYSAIFWTGSGICENRVLNITKKKGLNCNITYCLKIDKRQEWVNHLLEKSQLTSSGRYCERRVNKIENKNAPKTKTIGKCGLERSNHRNNHKSQQKLEKTKEREVHDREILLSKIIAIYLKPSVPTEYFVIST
jgi:hypothetical protein